MVCNTCGSLVAEEDVVCKQCGKSVAALDIPMTGQLSDQQIENGTDIVRKGLTGWLALLGLSLVFAPFYLGYELYGFLGVLGVKQTVAGLGSLILFEFIAALALFAFSLHVLSLYWYRKLRFPSSYILYASAMVCYGIIDVIWLYVIRSDAAAELQPMISENLTANIVALARSILFATIWTLYLLKSKQVKATFIE